MDVHADLDAGCSPDVLFDMVDDLGRYPQWLDLVARADVLASADEEPAWRIDLRAGIGRLTRSKRLRMVRTVHDRDTHRVLFDRRELDGRRHAAWTLSATVGARPTGSSLHMHLHYGGTLWTGAVLERVLSEQIVAGRTRLLELVEPTH